VKTNVSQSYKGRHKCYIRTYKFFQIHEFNGEVNTFLHVETNSPFFQISLKKTYGNSSLFDEYQNPILYTRKI